jgi:hypothetical protein
MTLLSVVKDVCSTVGVAVPQSVFSNITGNRTMQEMLTNANKCAQRIAYDTRDWTRLRTTQTYTGNGVAEAFDLPANYKRMLLTANVWRSTSSVQPVMFIPDTDDWLNRRQYGWNSPHGEWTMMGGQMHIFPVLEADESVYYPYLNKNCIALNGGGFGDSFLNDNDSFVLDERVLQLGMIWQWKADKGTPYTEDMGSYGDALTMAMGHDSPAPIILGHRPLSHSVKVSYPFRVPT